MSTSKMDAYQTYIHRSRYARYRYDLGRRETWEETVDRLIDFWVGRFPRFEEVLASEVRPAILNLEVMPSMRTLMTAGPALDRDEVAGYNCSALPIESLRDFDELLYILMCGTGVGFSVERRFVSKLPALPSHFEETDDVVVVADSKIGWAKALREFLALLWSGRIPAVDVSRVRPRGAPLRTFGGRASGPGPLVDLLRFVKETVLKAAGRKLTSLEAHDIACKIADVVVVGGVRRSALISLSDLDDTEMRSAKTGAWWQEYPHRALANNSAVYEGKPNFGVFLDEWHSLYKSFSGERGVFNREASARKVAENGRRDPDYDWLTNPCSEIILRPRQFCNLSEVVVRAGDTKENLARKVRLATLLGTLQSTLTNFRYLRSEWKRNTEEERLLGVSLTGVFDDLRLFGGEAGGALLRELRAIAVAANKEYARELDIPQSAAVTCVKPSGTVSQLVDSASGLHPRFSKYYIRRVRSDITDPLAKFLLDSGVPCEPDKLKPEDVLVFSFPQAAPDSAVVNDDIGALRHFEIWRNFQHNWCEHKPSVTIYYRNNEEFLELGAEVYRHFDECSGVSFLPLAEHSYEQAPYEEITEEQYRKLLAAMPEIDWDRLAEYETSDNTTGTQELACTGNACEIT